MPKAKIQNYEGASVYLHDYKAGTLTEDETIYILHDKDF